MKCFSKYFLIGLTCSLCLSPKVVQAELEVSGSVRIRAVSDFHAPLSPHGTWVEVGGYGRCWRPSGVAVGWQPYSHGNWVYTDHGWYWASDEPWSWACYHYGSWAHNPVHGWIWVPGIEWAPAWVYWRIGGGHCGWAPRGPKGVIVAPASFMFVEAKHFHERVTPSTLIVKNAKVIDQTTEVGSVKFETRTLGGGKQKVAINEGPSVAAIQKATGKAPEAVSIPKAIERDSVSANAMKRLGESQRNDQPSAHSPSDSPKPDNPSSKPGKSPGKGGKGKGKG